MKIYDELGSKMSYCSVHSKSQIVFDLKQKCPEFPLKMSEVLDKYEFIPIYQAMGIINMFCVIF